MRGCITKKLFNKIDAKMTYEFLGNVCSITERSGQSARGPWKMWEVLLEHDCTGQYPRRVVLNVWDENVANVVAICKGNNTQVRLAVSVDAREANGKWFNDLRAYRAEAVYAQPNYGYQQQPMMQHQGFVPPALPMPSQPYYQGNANVAAPNVQPMGGNGDMGNGAPPF